ncbi:hypothetical protein BDW74DRAFT_43357 [Aspergillus multicolor]|uniref:uncharacterized protein n=1 Tax=Aspergillus multicolor TaxID=41759 RepID=UPI003CCDA9A4
MNAYAYLIRHGWSGPGNPLNPDGAGARSGLGLTKPLLVARRSGNQGVGNKTTKDPTNQWWLRGFEDALKGIGAPKEDTIIGKGNALTSELYRHFVRGELIPGTLGKKQNEKNGEGEKGESKKRKREVEGEESKEERRVRREEKRRRKAEKEVRREAKRLKREEKAKKAVEKAERKERKAVEKAERKERKAKEKEEKRARKAEKEMTKDKNPEDDYPTPVSMDLDSTNSQDGASSLDTEKPKKNEKKDKEKESKKDKASKESTKDKKRESSSDKSSKRKSKKSKTT